MSFLPRESDQAERILIIDGHSLIYRSFFALPGFVNSSGFPTNAIYGFLRTLLKVLREWPSRKVVLTLDAKGETHRHKTYEEYKANRPEMPDDLAKQMPKIECAVTVLGIPVVKKQGYEADDLIATITKIATSHNLDVLIASSDKDLMQLVSDKVKMIVPSTKGEQMELYNEKKVEEKLGVPPKLVADLLGLKGDSSDNIPGVPHIGQVRAKKLLSEFGSFEEIYSNLDRIDSKRILETLKEHRDEALQSRELVQLHDAVPVGNLLEEAEQGEPNLDEFRDFLREMEFTSLLDELPSEREKINCEIVVSQQGLDSVCRRIENARSVSVDLETTGIDAMTSDIVGISLAFTSGEGYYIPVEHEDCDCLDRDTVLNRLKPYLQKEKISKIGQNLKYDGLILKRYDIDLRGISFDTMIASYLLKPTKRQHNLKEIVKTYLERDVQEFDDLFAANQKPDFRKVPINKAARYAIEDSEVIWELKQRLETKLEKRDQLSLLREIEIPLISILFNMEFVGIKFEKEKLERGKEELKSMISNLQKEINDLAGKQLNPNSPKQVREVLFEELELPVIETTKTGPSTNSRVLRKLSREHPLPLKIMKYREFDKLLNTYVNKLPQTVNEKTGRIHTCFNQTATATGRLSSSDPNLQNIPKGGELGGILRRAFVAPDGCKLIGADYSQIELRILAHLSQDNELIKTFVDEEDLHTKTAAKIFNVSPNKVDSSMRDRAKRVNFGIVYGITEYGLARDLNISKNEAQQYIDRFFNLYPEAKRFLDRLVANAERKGYAETIFGRRRFLPNINSSDWNRRNHDRRNAINMPIQGAAADLMKLAMIKVYSAIEAHRLRGKLLLQVHDELILEVSETEAKGCLTQLKKIMEEVVELDVPLNVEVSVGDDWSQL